MIDLEDVMDDPCGLVAGMYADELDAIGEDYKARVWRARFERGPESYIPVILRKERTNKYKVDRVSDALLQLERLREAVRKREIVTLQTNDLGMIYVADVYVMSIKHPVFETNVFSGTRRLGNGIEVSLYHVYIGEQGLYECLTTEGITCKCD